jgi:glycerol kinase
MRFGLLQISCAAEVIAKRDFREGIAAIGITNQRETTIVWDRETSEPTMPLFGKIAEQQNIVTN